VGEAAELRAPGRRMRAAVWTMGILLIIAAGVIAFLLARGGGSAVDPSTFLHPTGAWQIDQETSQLDGSRKYRALLYADTAAPNIIGQPERAILGFDCAKDGLLAGVNWPAFFGGGIAEDPHATVRWRVDGGPIQSGTWIVADRMTAVKGPEATALLLQLSLARKVTISASAGHSDQEATFTLSGLAAVRKDLVAMKCA
jgi:hypothetical protein